MNPTTTMSAEGADAIINKSTVMTELCRKTGVIIDHCSEVQVNSPFELEATAHGTYHVRWHYDQQAVKLISIVTDDASLYTDRKVVAAFAKLAAQATLRLIAVRVLPEQAQYWQQLGFTPCRESLGTYEKAL